MKPPIKIPAGWRKNSKPHRFTLYVATPNSRSSAYYAVLAAFAKRQPDGCKFTLIRRIAKKLRK